MLTYIMDKGSVRTSKIITCASIIKIMWCMLCGEVIVFTLRILRNTYMHILGGQKSDILV